MTVLLQLTSGPERFTTQDLVDLSSHVADLWHDANGCDWSARAGTLEWSCLHTADHAVDCVYAPAFFLASRRTDRYSAAGADLTLGSQATPDLLCESLHIAARLLCGVVKDTPPDTLAIIFQGQQPVVGTPADFLPRAALELALHAYDVASGLGVQFEPDNGLSHRLREHTRTWQMWSRVWSNVEVTDDPFADLLKAADRVP